MTPIEHHDEALADFRESADWYYDNRSPDLADRFVDAVESAEEFLRKHPRAGRPYLLGTREHPVRGFPYRIVYLEDVDRLFVVAVAHARREEGYWQERLE